MQQNLEGKLQAIKELKAEYGLGSKQAHDYLKVYAEYDELAQRVGTLLQQQGIKYKPTNREVSNLSNHSVNVFKDFLQIIADKRAKKFGKHSKRQIILGYSKMLEQETILLGDMSETHTNFTFDHVSFLTDFFRIRHEVKDNPQAFRKAFVQYRPTFKREGEEYTYEQISCKDELLIFSGDGPEDEITYDSDDYRENFKSWVIGDAPSEVFRYGKLYLESLTWEEKILLFGNGGCRHDFGGEIYDRAQREMTLGYMWVERRIALNELIKFDDENNFNESSSIDDKIAAAIDNVRKSSQTRQDILKRLLSVRAPNVQIEKQKGMIAKSQYKLQAIISNKKWLNKVLSR